MNRNIMKHRHSLLTIPRRRRARGAALVETAILLPLYLIILFGLLYFGYATLSKQAQTSAAQYAAWLPQTQSAEAMLERFWPWAGKATALGGGSGTSEAEAVDIHLRIEEPALTSDPYYGTDIPTQLVDGKGSLPGAGGRTGDVFNLERLTVDLWTYALGEINQDFVWTESGIEERISVSYDDMANFLSTSAQQNWPDDRKIGFVDTPVSAGSDVPPNVSEREPRIADAINGGSDPWLERRRVTVKSTYRPPFFKNVYSEQDARPTDYATYISLQYKEPDYDPTAQLTFDVTGRGRGERRAAHEDGGSSATVLADAAGLLGEDELPLAGGMDHSRLGVFGKVEDGWRAKTSDN